MKATVQYKSGLMLVIPKASNGPLLFLEWMSHYRAAMNVIHKIIDDMDGVIKIRLNLSKKEYVECCKYINDNL